ncbi:MAG: hypothetical protein ACREVR_18065 [Burkholderiales bacterium]
MLNRFKPDPLPAINPVPEYRAEGRKKELYEDTKRVLQVPWMGVVTMALSHYQDFYEVFWQAVRPIMASQEGVNACRLLRSEIETDVLELDPPKRLGSLRDLGYAPREIENLKDAVEVFSHGNFFYTMMATLSRLALESNEFPAPSPGSRIEQQHAPDVSVPFVLMEEHHADDPTRELYSSIRKSLGLPFVNTDYRALARWPSYFRLAWNDLAAVIPTREYEAIVTKLHERFIDQAIRLPNPTGTTAQQLRKAADESGAVDEVLAVNQLFQWLLPGLITNVAFFRQQLH